MDQDMHSYIFLWQVVSNLACNHLGNEASQEGIAGNVEWNSKPKIAAALIHLARQLAFSYIELHAHKNLTTASHHYEGDA